MKYMPASCLPRRGRIKEGAAQAVYFSMCMTQEHGMNNISSYTATASPSAFGISPDGGDKTIVIYITRVNRVK